MARFGSIGEQFFDDSGRPLSRGLLYFYESGTEDTDKTVYSDINLTIPHAQPVVLDDAGRQPDIYFDGAAKVVLATSADVTVETRDPVPSSGQAQDAFADWNGLVAYDAGAVVKGSDNLYYISIGSANLNNNPTSTSGSWMRVGFVNDFESTFTYQTGDIAVGSNGALYRSLVDDNVGNNPVSSPSEWSNLAIDITALANDVSFSKSNPSILGADTDGVLTISANSGVLGAVAKFYGDTHATKAGDFELYDDTTLVLQFDASAGLFDFQNNDITTGGDLLLDAGSAINWAGGGVTITESSDALNHAGATGGYFYDNGIFITAAAPTLFLWELGEATDEKITTIANNGGAVLFQLVNDALTIGRNFMQVNRTTYTVDSIYYGNATDLPGHRFYGVVGIGTSGNAAIPLSIVDTDGSDNSVYIQKGVDSANPALNVYTNNVFSGTGLIRGTIDEATSTGACGYFWNDGVGFGLVIDHNNTASGTALNIDSEAATDYCVQVAGLTNDYLFYLGCEHATSPNGLRIDYSVATPNGTGNNFLYLEDATALRARIASNGGLYNYQSNDSDLSDGRLKTDLELLDGQEYYNKFSMLKIGKYSYLDDRERQRNIGVIAQQVLGVAEEFVNQGGFSGDDDLLSVYNKDLYFAHIAVTQEIMKQVEAIRSHLVI